MQNLATFLEAFLLLCKWSKTLVISYIIWKTRLDYCYCILAFYLVEIIILDWKPYFSLRRTSHCTVLVFVRALHTVWGGSTVIYCNTKTSPLVGLWHKRLVSSTKEMQRPCKVRGENGLHRLNKNVFIVAIKTYINSWETSMIHIQY